MIGGAARVRYFLRCFRIIGDASGPGPRLVVSAASEPIHLRADETAIAVSNFNQRPERIAEGGVVLVMDTLQHLEQDQLTAFLKQLASLPSRFLFVVPLIHSPWLLKDGTNTNKMVQPRDWWARVIAEAFGSVEPIKSFSEFDAAFVTGALSPGSRKRISRLWPMIALGKELARLRSRLTLLARRAAGGIISQKELLAAVEGKSVSLVGNARSLGQKQQGEQIDANDIVVRFNRAPFISLAANGARTDWLATSVALESAFVEVLDPQRILWMSNRRGKINVNLATAAGLYLHPTEDVARLSALVEVDRPTTGLMLIDLLARSRCRSVELYGFDFYKSQSLSGHQTIDNTPHVYSREETYVLDLIAKDPRFKLCR